MTGRPRILDGAGAAGAPLWVIRLFPFLLFALSFAPRLVALNRYVTPDEAVWVYRSIQFREALLDGRPTGTLVAGHPGVTTTWLGALGATAQLQLSPETREAYDWLTTMAYLTPDNVEAFERLAVFLTGGRIAVALVNSLGVVGVYFLARRLWGQGTAMVAGLFLALDPFLVGLSGLLHVDGLCATFATLSLLALAVGLRPKEAGGRGSRFWPWLVFSGASAGLAVLSKSPALLLLPISGLALLWPVVRDRHLPWRNRLSALLRDGLVWGAAFLAAVLLLYPALWASPAAVVAIVGGSANRHLDEALRETFFLGRAAFDHGPLFYPVVLLWRLSPVVWLALIPAVRLLIEKRKRGAWWSASAFPVLLLAVWVALFLAAITPAAKKFDRYILPVVPALLLLAAVAWVSWARRDPRLGRRVLPIVLLAQLVFWLAFAAYPLSAYNPLVGGPWAAVRVLPVGWGEGIGASGRHLTETRPDAVNERAIAGVAPSLAPFFVGQTLVYGVDDAATADYTIVTLGGRQLDPTAVDAQTAGLDLIHTEHFGGLDQAWVYENSSPQASVAVPELPEPVIFGNQIALTAYGQSVEDDTVNLQANWRRLTAAAAGRYVLRIAILDGTGNNWATQETDLLNEVYFFPPDWAADDSGTVRYLLGLPPGIPPGPYHVVLSLVDDRTAGQLPVRVGAGEFQGVTYTAGQIDVPPPATIVSASRMQIPVFSEATWLNGSLQLLGRDEIPAEALAGSQLPVSLFWHVPQGRLPPGLPIAWTLRAAGGGDNQVVDIEPLSRYDTGLWRTGETIQEKYQVPLPPDLPAGRYELSVSPLRPNGEPAGSSYPLAELRINNIDRAYELPDDIPVALRVEFGPMTLWGMAPRDLVGRAGELPEMTLYWEKSEQYGEVYTVFVHVLNEDGDIVLQADHWPGGLPTNVLDDGQVITDRFPLPLPADLPPGEYPIRVGLYSADSGQRLPVIDSGALPATLAGPDYVILPVMLQVTAP